jgi:hypothetical protein
VPADLECAGVFLLCGWAVFGPPPFIACGSGVVQAESPLDAITAPPKALARIAESLVFITALVVLALIGAVLLIAF